eukprot:Colp12_sorted_trinity150504_noHs@31871
MATNMPYIGESTVRRLLGMKECIDAMELALSQFSDPNGGVEQPVRSNIHVKDHNGYFFTMPAYSRSANAMGAKLVTFYPDNKEIPSTMASIILQDPRTGQVLTTLDGTLITEMRTAAVSAAACRRLASHGMCKVLAVVGTGVQARSHIAALKCVLEFSEVRVWSRSHDKVVEFAKMHGAVACETVEECLAGADVIAVCTNSSTPVVCKHHVKKGAIIAAVGACSPELRELDDALMHSAVVLVDSRSAALQESGDIIQTGIPIYAEIGEVFLQRIAPPPHGETVVFKSLGLAVEDIVTAKLVYDKLRLEC